MIRPAERFHRQHRRPEPDRAPRVAMARASRVSADHRRGAGRHCWVRRSVASCRSAEPIPSARRCWPGAVRRSGHDRACCRPVRRGRPRACPRPRDPARARRLFYAAVGTRSGAGRRAARARPAGQHPAVRASAARLPGGGGGTHAVRVAELTLGGRRVGPVELPVGLSADAPSVLGADLLDEFADRRGRRRLAAPPPALSTSLRGRGGVGPSRHWSMNLSETRPMSRDCARRR